MTKEVLLLFSQDVYPDGNAPYRQHAEFLNQIQGDQPQVQFLYGVLKELIFVYDGAQLSITEPRTGRDISSFDLVFFQKWMSAPQHAYAAAVHLDRQQTDFFSREVLHQNPFSKLSEMVLLVQRGLPYPKTIIAPLQAIKGVLGRANAPFSYPIILKSIEGTRGQDNHLIHSEVELSKIADDSANTGVTYMAQEFISNECDYRLTIMGGQLIYILQRTAAKGSHLNNTSQGAKAAIVPNDYLAVNIVSDALAAASAVYREDFAGVDILVDANKHHWILEVNKSPEIQTGFNAEYKSQLLADYIKRRLLG